MKSAMRAGEKERLGVIRMLLAALKQREIDERIELTDAVVLQTVEKLVKQRRESAAQYAAGQRPELEARELAEIRILEHYLPQPLAPAELEALIDETIRGTGATSIKDMGRVMNAIRDQAQGRADMAQVSQQVKARLAGS
ncbi:MAG: GatB/YqeY domain-containing protein [Chromatiales bacterium]|nr:GatB/YqeY domain-containing protein [Chromatiales bacterium]